MNASSKPRVIVSIENDARDHCVDIFERADGSFGYETFRRDPEENHGWRSLARTSGLRFETVAATTQSARTSVPWLDGNPDWDRFARNMRD